MRHLISKLMTGSMVAGAALLVAACGSSETANTSTENTTMTDLNTMAPEGTTNDMTAIDAAGGNMADNSMMMDNASSNSADMMANNGM